MKKFFSWKKVVLGLLLVFIVGRIFIGDPYTTPKGLNHLERLLHEIYVGSFAIKIKLYTNSYGGFLDACGGPGSVAQGWPLISFVFVGSCNKILFLSPIGFIFNWLLYILILNLLVAPGTIIKKRRAKNIN